MRRYSRNWGMGLVLGLAAFSIAAGRGDAPLVDAAKNGDAKAVRALLDKRVNVNATTVDGTTALHWAVHRNDLPTVDQLLRAGANVTLANSYGVAPFSMAAENGNVAMIERLLKAGADPNTTLPGGETALMTTARTGNTDAVKVLLAHGANPNARESTRDQTALMWAAAQGNTAAINVLVEAGAEVNARSSELKAFHVNTFVAGRTNADFSERLPMFTPFLFAVRGGHIDAARALLKAGANVNDAGPDGTPALHIACINAHWALAALLLDRGADATVESPGGTALHHIARARSAAMMVKYGGLPPPVATGTMTAMALVTTLVAHGANVNARMTKPLVSQSYGIAQFGQVGLTPLLMTAIPADPEYMRVLLANGADPTLTTVKGTTLLMGAAGVGLGSPVGDDAEALTVVKKALELGLDVNARNNDGDTALHGAAFRAYNPLVQYLVDHGAQLDAKNKLGWTPLMTAHWNFSGALLRTWPETEALLRRLSEARGLPTDVPTQEEATQQLVYARGGPTISCPPAETVRSAGGSRTIITYPMAAATSRILYDNKMTVTCTPPSGSEFPVGTTTVTCTAVDGLKQSDSCAVLMRVLP